MPDQEHDDTVTTIGTAAPAATVNEAVADGGGVLVGEASTLRIQNRTRDVQTFTVGDKTITYTPRLSGNESRMLAKANLQADGAYVWNRAAASVRQINGDPIPFPNAESQIAGILDRIGDDAADYLFMQLAVSMGGGLKADAKN